jgi:hypothetical protein
MRLPVQMAWMWNWPMYARSLHSTVNRFVVNFET